MEPLIIFEDENFLVLNKPAGLLMHGDGVTTDPTVADWILRSYPMLKGVGEPAIAKNGSPIVRPGIVHRLDRETSGVVVVAKTQTAYEHLKQQFEERQISKEYRAVVHGNPRHDGGVIDAPIGKHAANFRVRTTKGATGAIRDAVTEYSVLERFAPRHGAPDGYALLAVFPKTGRTHQIRVHLKSIGHTVVCDSLYAPHRQCEPEMGRLALHALKLSLADLSGEQRSFEAPIPPDMARFLAHLRG